MAAELERCEWVPGQVPLPGMPDDEWDDDLRECSSCGDAVGYLSSDDLCDGCVAEECAQSVLVPVVTRQPLARYL